MLLSDPDISHLRKYSREAETSYLSSHKEVTDMDKTIKLQQAQIQRLNSENETLNNENQQLHNQVKVLTVLQSQLESV